MSQTQLNQPKRAPKGALFAALRPCSVFVSWCIALVLSLSQLFLFGCSGSDHSSTSSGGGGPSTGGSLSAGATNSTADSGDNSSGGQSAAGGGALTTGGVSVGGTSPGVGSSTSNCAALWSSCQSVKDCCSTGYQLVCNGTCQPALVASGGSTSVTCLADSAACSTNAQCCSSYCSGGQCVTNAHIDLPTGGSSSMGGNSATGGSSAAGGITGTAAGECSSTQTLCNATCVDLKSDTSNCGSCGIGCSPGASCIAGACVCPNSSCPTVLAANLGATPKSLLVDSNNIYWIAPSTAGENPKINKLAKSSGTIVTMYELSQSASMGDQLQAMTQTTDYLYATWVGCGVSSCSGGVLQLRKEGSALAYLAGSTAYMPTGVAATDAAVYWIDRGQNSFTKGISALSPPTSVTATQVAPWSGESLLVIADTLFYTSCGVPYYDSPCSIGSLPTSGGTSTNLSASTQSAIPSVTTNGTYAYWTECAGGLYRASPGSGATRQVVVPGVKCSALAVDEVNAYLIDGSLWRTPLDGSARSALFAIQGVSALAVDESRVYVASSWQGGSILSAPK